MPVYKDKNNTYFVACYYKNWKGERKKKFKKGFKLSREAKEWETKFLNTGVSTPDMLFSNLTDNYLEDCKARLKPTTYIGKEYMINNRFIPLLGNLQLKNITPVTIRKWQNEILKYGYAPTYQRTMNSQLSAIFNYAVRYYGLIRNPVRIAGTIGKKHRDQVTFWTLEQFNSFIKCFTTTTPLYAAFLLLFYSGIREGELLALTVGDVNTFNNTISITKNYAIVNGMPHILPPKTPKSRRVIDLPCKVINELLGYIATLYNASNTDRLFCTLNKYSLGKALKEGAICANVPIIRVHDIRHSHASLLINMGVSPLAISERLGHEKIETTLQIYSHLYPNTKKEIATKLNEFL